MSERMWCVEGQADQRHGTGNRGGQAGPRGAPAEGTRAAAASQGAQLRAIGRAEGGDSPQQVLDLHSMCPGTLLLLVPPVGSTEAPPCGAALRTAAPAV